MFIPSNDHRPEHVHIVKAEREAVFLLNCPNGPVLLRENFGFNRGQIDRIERAMNPIVSDLCGEWEKIHGDP